MQITRDSVFHLRPDRVEVSTPVDGTILDAEVRWVDEPELRGSVQDLVWDLVEAHHATWFASECGRCGTSCRRPGLLVRESELLALGQKVGLDPEEFRARYLDPACTWNPGDGVLRLQDGACPFLQGGVGSVAGSATCAVHDVRPLDCRSFLSSAPFCRKETRNLVDRLERLTLHEGRVLAKVRGRSEAPPEADPGPWERMRALLEPLEAQETSRYSSTLERSRTLIHKMLAEYPGGGTAEDHRRRLEGLRDLVYRFEEMGLQRPDETGPLEEIRQLFHRLEDMVLGRREPESPEVPAPETPGAPGRLARMTVTEQGLAVHYRFPEGGGPEGGLFFAFVPYWQHPDLAEGARALLFHVLTQPDEELQADLVDEDPPCFLCGECCRVYAVEIAPTDVDRLAEHLGLPREEFEAEYTVPGRFSWNRARRILSKVERPLRPRSMRPGPEGQLPLPLPVIQSQKECVFLEYRDDGNHYCSVYLHRPDVCRGYSPRHDLCRRTNQVANWGRQAGNLLALDVGPGELGIRTRRGERRGQPPRTVPRSEWPSVDRQASLLEAGVEELLDRAARQLVEALGGCTSGGAEEAARP